MYLKQIKSACYLLYDQLQFILIQISQLVYFEQPRPCIDEAVRWPLAYTIMNIYLLLELFGSSSRLLGRHVPPGHLWYPVLRSYSAF